MRPTSPATVLSSRMTGRSLLTVFLVGLISVGCSAPSAEPAPSASVADATSPSNVPVEEQVSTGDLMPGATLSPTTLADVPVPGGLRIVMLTSGQADGLVDPVVRSWAEANAAALEQVSTDLDTMHADVRAAVEAAPDLVVVAGPEVVDLVGFESSQYLNQHFLVVGGQLAEPTLNVTSVIWPGAAARGAGVDPTADLDFSSFTDDRVTDALDAGVRVFLDGSDGYVVDLG